MKGGARKGAGRKAGSTKVLMNFKLEGSTAELLRKLVPRGRRVAFVEQALLRALDHLPSVESRPLS